MKVDLGAVRRVFASYRGAALTTRAFVAARLVVAPLSALGQVFEPLTGRVLSLGSGVGVVERYLAERNPDLMLEGIDLNPHHVELIEATSSRSPRVELRLGDATEIDEPPSYDVVLVCDALHHFPQEAHKSVAVAIARSLRPGGVCIVKDLDVTPRWKHEWNRIHDRLVAGPEPIFCRSPEDTVKLFADAGLVAERADRIDGRLTPYAHYIVRLRKPPAPNVAGASEQG